MRIEVSIMRMQASQQSLVLVRRSKVHCLHGVGCGDEYSRRYKRCEEQSRVVKVAPRDADDPLCITYARCCRGGGPPPRRRRHQSALKRTPTPKLRTHASSQGEATPYYAKSRLTNGGVYNCICAKDSTPSTQAAKGARKSGHNTTAVEAHICRGTPHLTKTLDIALLGIWTPDLPGGPARSRTTEPVYIYL